MTVPGHPDQALKVQATTAARQDRYNVSDDLECAIDPLASPFGTPPSQGLDQSLPNTNVQRQQASTAAHSLDKDSSLQDKILTSDESDPVLEDVKSSRAETVLYLAYGSNLSSKTFRGSRGIQPLSQIGVVVPKLRLTFDIPGLPYLEPCFAATQFRTEKETVVDDGETSTENDPLIAHLDYYKDTWLKPLVGVVYEVTMADYARIIATEGGGRGYKDIVVDCYPFPDSYRPSDPVPCHPVTRPFKAHSLLSPAAEENRDQLPVLHRKRRTPVVRPDPTHAQPSPRYLDLIATGAAEHDLPVSYRQYLAQIRPYRVTTMRQAIGRVLFVGLWGPAVLATMFLSRMLAGPDGRSPDWVIALSNLVLQTMWRNYDAVFVMVFGEGERTIGDT